MKVIEMPMAVDKKGLAWWTWIDMVVKYYLEYMDISFGGQVFWYQLANTGEGL